MGTARAERPKIIRFSTPTEEKHREANEKWSNKFWGKLVLSLTLLPLIMWIWPKTVPFKFFELWELKGGLSVWLLTSVPIFIWGISVNVVYLYGTRNHPEVNRNAEKLIVAGLYRATRAGVVEEITFRWLFFFWAIITAKISNVFLLGFPGWFHMHVLGPIVNLVTFGKLESLIYHSSGWAVGAAMIATNSFFRDGHRYQGFFGWLNSWCIGMYLFWVLAEYGLLAAIIVHFTYNFLIYLTGYVDAVVERAQGYV